MAHPNEFDQPTHDGPSEEDYSIIAGMLRHAAASVEDALDDPHMNHRTALELGLMVLGSEAYARGMGDDVARWVSNGVANQRKRDNPGPNVQRPEVRREYDAKPRCICGYIAVDEEDLDNHVLASLDDEDPPTGSVEHRSAR